MSINDTKIALSALLDNARHSTKFSLINYTDRLLEEYRTISEKLTAVKEISVGWISALVNRKAMKLLSDKLKKIKQDIKSLINSYSSLNMSSQY